MPATASFIFRAPRLDDLEPLLALELEAFTTDRLSRKRMRHWIRAKNRAFIVCTSDSGELAGYMLIFYRKDSSTARLYSIAITATFRGHGLARQLLAQGEALAAQAGYQGIRLEVREENHAAIALYKSLGYQPFGRYPEFYEDGQDALRFQKRF